MPFEGREQLTGRFIAGAAPRTATAGARVADSRARSRSAASTPLPGEACLPRRNPQAGGDLVCARCGYGISVSRERLLACAMCAGSEWRPITRHASAGKVGDFLAG